MVGTWDISPNYHYIQYMTVYIVNTYIFISTIKLFIEFICNDIYNAKYEIMGAKEGQKPLSFLIQ